MLSVYRSRMRTPYRIMWMFYYYLLLRVDIRSL